MKKSKYADYVKAGAVATCGETASSGWSIYAIEHGADDYVIAGYITSRTSYPARKYKVYYSSGHCASPYFRAYGRRMYLDVFIKTGRG